MGFSKGLNILKIFNNYEINEFLGSGAMGMAFSLKDPHENYVLKIEMHLSSPESHKKRPGADYVSSLYKKQQSGERESGEINILDFDVINNVHSDFKAFLRKIIANFHGD